LKPGLILRVVESCLEGLHIGKMRLCYVTIGRRPFAAVLDDVEVRLDETRQLDVLPLMRPGAPLQKLVVVSEFVDECSRPEG